MSSKGNKLTRKQLKNQLNTVIDFINDLEDVSIEEQDVPSRLLVDLGNIKGTLETLNFLT